MILRFMGAYLFLEALGSLMYYRNVKTKRNIIFQFGRAFRIVTGLVLIVGVI